MLRIINLMVLLVSVSYPLHAENVQQNNVTPLTVGSHVGNVFYMNLQEGFTKPCAYGLAYCKMTDLDSCRSMLSTVLAAKTTGTKLSQFRYDYDPSNHSCYIWLTAIQ